MTAPAFDRSTRTRRSDDRAVTLHLRMSEAMAAALAKMAADNFRSRHALMRKVLADRLVADGYLSADKVGPVRLRRGEA